MALSPAAADAVAEAICANLGVSDLDTVANWKKIMEPIYAGILADIEVTLQTGTVVTVGSPATQTGPQAPVPLTIA